MTRSSGNLVSSLLQIFRILPPLLPLQRWVLIIIFIIVYYHTGTNSSDVQYSKKNRQTRLDFYYVCLMSAVHCLTETILENIPFFCGFLRAVMVFSACFQLQLEQLQCCLQNGFSFVEYGTFRSAHFPLLTKGISFKV